ncbi:MAG: hypothetical protein ABI543_09800 [Ignavibacteria bacterium]
MYNKDNQLYIEAENNRLFVYIHLQNLRPLRASRIFDNYIEAYREKDFEEICVSFWNIGIPGEHLSTFRRTNNLVIGKILKGIKYIDAYFHYRDNVKKIHPTKYVV